jgi:hypothetical protein
VNKVDPNPPDPHRFTKLMATMEERKRINDMFVAYRVLIDSCGWREIMYAPKDGTPFEVITVGSIGIFAARWLGEKDDLLFVEDGGDLWPAQAMLFRLTQPKTKGE